MTTKYHQMAWCLDFSNREKEKMATNVLRNYVFSAFLVSAVFAYYVSASEQGDHWRYFGIYGVENWSAIYADCNAVNHTRQSPVNIVRTETEANVSLTQIDLVIDRVVNSSVTMVNNGHTVNLDFNQTSIHLSGGGLSGKFRVGGVHFHWGNNNTEGSEHTIDGTRFPIEMHVVTYDESRYTGVIQASGGVNSIAVLGVLFQLSTANNSALDPVISRLQGVVTAGEPMNIPYVDMRALLPLDTSRYYRYLGSLTTPPCSESVIWSVFEANPHISSSQLNEFRKLQELIEANGKIDFLMDNWRATQLLHGRTVQRSFITSGTDLGFSMMPPQLGLIMTMGLMLQFHI